MNMKDVFNNLLICINQRESKKNKTKQREGETIVIFFNIYSLNSKEQN
jgi:hypothetical protein